MQYLQSIEVTSDPTKDARPNSQYNPTVSGLKSYDDFYFTYSQGLDFRGCSSLGASINAASIWYNTPNIYETNVPTINVTQNNLIEFWYWEIRDLTNLATYPQPLTNRVDSFHWRHLIFTIPTGFYTVDTLNALLNDYMNKESVQSKSGKTDYDMTDQIFYFESRSYDSKINLVLQAPQDDATTPPYGGSPGIPTPTQRLTLPWDFKDHTYVYVKLSASSPRDLLGFKSGTELNQRDSKNVIQDDRGFNLYNTTTLYMDGKQTLRFTGENRANFNTITHYYIHSDITNRGIPINGKEGQVVAKIPIPADLDPGSQLNYVEHVPRVFDASVLKNNQSTRFRFWITDQNFRPVHTMGTTWSCRVDFLPVKGDLMEFEAQSLKRMRLS